MLTRPNLRYLSDGHPIFNQREIEDYAETLLSAHFPSRVAMPSPLKAGDLMTLINDEDGVVTKCDDLGSEGQRKRLGRMYLKRKIIVLDHVIVLSKRLDNTIYTECRIIPSRRRRKGRVGGRTMGPPHFGLGII